MRNMLCIACKEKKPMGVLLKYEEDMFYGFVMAMGEKLMLFAEHYDFMPNGFCIFALEEIDEIRAESGFQKEMIEHERLVDRFGKIPQVRLDSWVQALEDLKGQGTFVAAEPKDGGYYPGVIEKVTPRTLQMSTFDREGVWDDKPLCMYQANIGRIRLGDHYLEMYVKYMDELI